MEKSGQTAGRSPEIDAGSGDASDHCQRRIDVHPRAPQVTCAATILCGLSAAGLRSLPAERPSRASLAYLASLAYGLIDGCRALRVGLVTQAGEPPDQAHDEAADRP